MNSAQHFAYTENPDNSAEVMREFEGTKEQALAWARVQTTEGYTAYVFDANDKMLDRRLWEDRDYYESL